MGQQHTAPPSWTCRFRRPTCPTVRLCVCQPGRRLLCLSVYRPHASAVFTPAETVRSETAYFRPFHSQCPSVLFSVPFLLSDMECLILASASNWSAVFSPNHVTSLHTKG
ncbi:unnamed protein product [Protopolystoma xenopodis]|uniref:Uncharacterized protein n=1 Tax=Protopolystoma xenopodis TaxID=117903 RepID=A0A448X0Q2_9PLAT|nr:unnamed protein product [Protopolystoma xenopodis]